MKKNPELTKKKIKEAFLELYKEKGIERISIGEVTKKAGLYRGTFYYYYKDIYDLQEQIELEIQASAMKVIPKLIDAILSKELAEEERLIEELFQGREQLLRLFFVEKPVFRMVKKLKEYAKATALKKLGIDVESLSKEIAYLAEYIASAQMGILTLWLEKGRDITSRELAGIVEAANLRGPMSYMLEVTKTKKKP